MRQQKAPEAIKFKVKGFSTEKDTETNSVVFLKKVHNLNLVMRE